MSSRPWRTYYSNGSLQNDNVPDSLWQFIREGESIDYVFNTNVAFGGPILKNRLWFFSAFRLAASDSFVAGAYYPNGDRARRENKPAPHGTFRLTSQLNANNKLRGAYYNSKSNTKRFDVGCSATSGNVVSCTSPEASYQLPVPMSQSADLKWMSTVTNRLLVEVAQSVAIATYRFDYQPENGPFAIQNRNVFTGWRTVASSTAYADYLSKVFHLNGTVTYVTGTHNLKAGVNPVPSRVRERGRCPDGECRHGAQYADDQAGRAQRRFRRLRPGSMDHKPPDALWGRALRLFQPTTSSVTGRRELQRPAGP